MFIMDCLGTDGSGRLTIGGIAVDMLANEFGTPLYIMDEDEIRKNCRTYVRAARNAYGSNALIIYAGKAFSCKQMCNIIKEEGMGLDVVSGGELYTAISADFPTERIYFHGNNKTEEELRLALNHNVGRIVVDNVFELNMLSSLAGEMNRTVDILFRIKPGIDAHTHEFISTGQIDSKFGVALETGEAEEIYLMASKLPNINIVGTHCHIGSQIFDYEPFRAAADKMLTFIADLKDKHGIEIKELNLGGGFGIKYTKAQHPVPTGGYIENIAEVVKEIAKKRGIGLPRIIMEPGRSIVANTGITVYTVGAIKKIPNTRTYVTIDGGMTDNPRYIMYESEYEALSVSNPLAKELNTVTIAGKCCETGDIIIRDAELPSIEVGDRVAILATGAYNYSMSSNYNRIPRPPVVMVANGRSRIAVRRETYDDIIRCDL